MLEYYLLLFVILGNANSFISPFGRPYEIPEKQTAAMQIVRVDCSIPGDSCICNLESTRPPNGPFDVWSSGSTSYYVHYVGSNNGQPLSYATTPSYILVIKCTNKDRTNSSFQELEIDIRPNSVPEITNQNYPHDLINLVAADVTLPGMEVYTVTARDQDNDVLSCSLTTSPAVDYFTIANSQSTGGTTECVIKSNLDLRSATESIVRLGVSVSDGRTAANTFYIDVNIALNTRPEIVNLPTTVTLPETANSGVTIATLSIIDPDVFVGNLQPSCTVSPSSEQYKFTFDTGTNRIRLSSLPNGAPPLDFETTSQYQITCQVTDGFLTSKDEVVTLVVTNVNESPVFDEVAYFCDLEESTSGGSSCDLSAVITDPEGDVISSVSFLPGNNSQRFRYDRSMSTVTFNVDYDVDQNSMPETVVLQLQAVDVLGASRTVPVYIRVHDVNDNTCDFGSRSTNIFHADQNTPLGSLGNFIARDEDRTSPNNLVTYEVIRALPADSSNYIAAFQDGSLAYIGKIPEVNDGKSYSLIVRCKDGGSPQRSSEGTIVLTYQTSMSTTTSTSTTTTSTSTTPAPTTSKAPSTNIFDSDAFVAIFAILMSLLLLGMLTGLYFLLRLCGCFNLCTGGLGGSGGRLCPEDFCCPKKKVEPEEELYINTVVRTNANYRDPYWKSGDHYETGTGYNPDNGDQLKALDGGFKRLALPAPPRHLEF